MAWRDWGNRAVWSTTAQPATNPSTATLIAEVDSTQLGTQDFAAGQSRLALVTWLLGSDTNATWMCEVVASTALNSTGESLLLKTAAGQTAQYVTTHTLNRNSRVRARVYSTFTGDALASISVEPLT